jgi:hypothetical protein
MRMFVSAIVLSSLAAAALPAQANETGLASIHAWRKVGKKTCMAEHSHAGSGTGATQKVAEAKAWGDWSSFTGFEYGSSWASPRNAIDRQLRCSPEGSGWSCQLDAKPCRPF